MDYFYKIFLVLFDFLFYFFAQSSNIVDVKYKLKFLSYHADNQIKFCHKINKISRNYTIKYEFSYFGLAFYKYRRFLKIYFHMNLYTTFFN